MLRPVQDPLSDLLRELARRRPPGLDPDEIRNLASEAVLRGQHNPPPDGQLRPWIYRIFRHLVIDRLRRLAMEKRMSRMAFDPECRPDPEHLVADAQVREQVHRAIEALPPQWQRPVQMRFIEGQDCGTIAAALGLPRVTVRTRIHRAVLVLRKKLAELRVVILGPIGTSSAILPTMGIVLMLGPTMPGLSSHEPQITGQLAVRTEGQTPSLSNVSVTPINPGRPSIERSKTPSPQPVPVETPPPVTTFAFDDDEIGGTGLQPDVDIITVDAAAPQQSLIEIPDSFLEPLLKSLEDL